MQSLPLTIHRPHTRIAKDLRQVLVQRTAYSRKIGFDLPNNARESSHDKLSGIQNFQQHRLYFPRDMDDELPRIFSMINRLVRKLN